MPYSTDQLTAARTLIARARETRRMLATAESCTGGGVAALITELPGASYLLERGFVTYTNESKAEMLGVPMDLIHAKGAVSADVAEAMVRGALEHSRADVAVSITGIAGPGGGSAEKPVGLVYIAAMQRGRAPQVVAHQFNGDRATVRQASVSAALTLINGLL
jgi:nicotinamide-nucleotide amidase